MISWSRILGTLTGMILIGAFAAGARAAPIYDMRGFLNEPNPFAQTPPPAPAAPQQRPGVPVQRPSAQPPAPTSGSGPMKMPQSLEAAPGDSAPGTSAAGGDREKSTPAASDSGPRASKPFVSEIRLGALVHDQGPFSSNKEDGYDANLEILFSSPSFLDFIWSPRPHIGATYNAYGDTSQAYLGLTWEWDFWQDFFAGFSLGGTVHNGELSPNGVSATKKKALGCRVLFRESITLGYRFNKTHSLMAFLDHSSNAKLCSHNEGLENVGIRYGYRF